MLHGNTAIGFIPCIHRIGFEQVQEKNFPCIMIHEIIICLYIILLPKIFVEVYDEMSIFGDTFVQLADEFFDRVNIFDCSFENSTIEEVGVGKYSLENLYMKRCVRSEDGSHLIFVVKISCAFWVLAEFPPRGSS